MAASYFRLFNFAILQRYRWRAVDFQDMQDNGLVSMIRAAWEAAYNGSILRGLDVASATGLNFTINPGIACGPTGNMMVIPSAVTGTLPSPTGVSGCRHLVVVRPYIVTPASAMITPPTQPLTTAPLVFDQMAQIVVLDGSTGGGVYPATGANDVIVFGVRLAQNATSFSPSGALYQDTDIPGRRSSYVSGRGQADLLAWDNRCRAYNAGTPSVGVKPSRTTRPELMTYTGRTPASIWPQATGGTYNGDAGDTFLNFKTGVISGADQVSGTFTQTIPAANTFIWALIAITGSDVLSVTYGTAGTYLQCRAAMKNQVTSGAGAVPTSATFKIAYVLLGSTDGTNITELDVFDARSFGGGAGASGGGGFVNWRIESNAPLESNSANLDTLDFDYLSSQEVWASIRVPDSYSGGTQINITGGQFACAATTNKVKFKTTTYLVRPGTTVLGTYPNSKDSTNAAITVNGVASTVTNIGTLDLTDSSGKINGVAVQAGDTLLVKLIRDTANESSSAQADARLVRFGMVPTF